MRVYGCSRRNRTIEIFYFFAKFRNKLQSEIISLRSIAKLFFKQLN